MSRSYREPWYTDGYKGSNRRQFYKRLSNKRVRRALDVPNGKAYRKYMEPWDICDYRYFYDAYPTVYFIRGKQELIGPSPIWRVARK